MARGRPRKITDENTILKEINVMETKVHVVVRFLSRMNRSNDKTGEISGADLDIWLTEWYEKGYRIVTSNYIGDAPEGHGILIVMQKET